MILTVCRLADTECYKGYDQIIKAMPEIVRAVERVIYWLVRVRTVPGLKG